MSDDFGMDDFTVDDDIDAGLDEMSPSDDEPTEADYLDMVRPSRAGLAEEDAYRAWETETPPARRWLREQARYCMPVMCLDEESGIVTFRDHLGRWRMMRGMEAVYAHLLKSQLSQCRRPHPAVVQRTCRRRRASSHRRASSARAPDDGGDGPSDPPVKHLLDLVCPPPLRTCHLSARSCVFAARTVLTTVLGDHRIPDTTLLGLRVAPKLIAMIVPLEKAAAASRYSLVQAPALPSGQDGSFTSLSGAGGLLAAQWAMIKTVAPVVPGASREGTR